MPDCHRFLVPIIRSIRNTLAALGVLGVSLAGFACGPPPNTRKVDNSTNVYIYTGAQSDEAPPAIDPQDPRVAVNEKRLAELIGRPLRFELEAAVAAQFGARLHEAYVAALESATGALARCQRDAPAAFAHGAERLETVRLTYTAIRARERPRVPLLEPTLTLPVAPNQATLLDGGALCAAFESGLAAANGAGEPQVTPQRARPAPSDPRLAQLQECESRAREALRTRDAGARRPLNADLQRCAAPLRDMLRAPAADAAIQTALDRAQSAWIEWVNEHMVELDESGQFSLVRELLRSGKPELEGLRKGFDAPRFALPLIDAWLQKAPPANRPSDFGSPLERCVVSVVEGSRWSLEPQNPCRGHAYSALARTAEGRQQLMQRLQRWSSELMTETAVVHTLRDEGALTTLALLDTLASDRSSTHVALRAVARYHQWATRGPQNIQAPVDARPLVAAAPAWWKKHPEQRAVYLYVLTQISNQNEGAVPWATLAQFLGGRIDAVTLRGYLALQPTNIWYVSQLSSALEPGIARTPLLRAGLDAYLEAFQAGKVGGTFRAADLADRLVATVCDGKSQRDLEQLRKATRELSEIHDGARGVTLYLSAIWSTPASQLCPNRDRATPERVLFGD